ncbi:hypothetical protein PR048_022107 [Dryococelus australis]|uniref:Uncharacterized protein n=1 Tax=Dryococelus australis TaxID=614101 RepID=A0ABQ9H038_9NEOP|nr:hypothetical protein PR048_022107 [Dryococelus australis]
MKWSKEIWTALNIEVLRADEALEFKGGGEREIPEKTRQPAASAEPRQVRLPRHTSGCVKPRDTLARRTSTNGWDRRGNSHAHTHTNSHCYCLVYPERHVITPDIELIMIDDPRQLRRDCPFANQKFHCFFLREWVFKFATIVRGNPENPMITKSGETVSHCSSDSISKYRNRIRLERASKNQSSDIHKTPYDGVKRCRERKKKTIKTSERVKRRRIRAKQTAVSPNTSKPNFSLIVMIMSTEFVNESCVDVCPGFLLKGPVCLQLFSAFEAKKHWSYKGYTAMRIQCVIVTKNKLFNPIIRNITLIRSGVDAPNPTFVMQLTASWLNFTSFYEFESLLTLNTLGSANGIPTCWSPVKSFCWLEFASVLPLYFYALCAQILEKFPTPTIHYFLYNMYIVALSLLCIVRGVWKRRKEICYTIATAEGQAMTGFELQAHAADFGRIVFGRYQKNAMEYRPRSLNASRGALNLTDVAVTKNVSHILGIVRSRSLKLCEKTERCRIWYLRNSNPERPAPQIDGASTDCAMGGRLLRVGAGSGRHPSARWSHALSRCSSLIVSSAEGQTNLCHPVLQICSNNPHTIEELQANIVTATDATLSQHVLALLDKLAVFTSARAIASATDALRPLASWALDSRTTPLSTVYSTTALFVSTRPTWEDGQSAAGGRATLPPCTADEL